MPTSSPLSSDAAPIGDGPADSLLTAAPCPDCWQWTWPVRLEVACGMLWVTRVGCLDDHWLAAGDTLDLPAGTVAWIGADPVGCSTVPARWRWHPIPSLDLATPT
jgi:hypothetical protein